MTDPLSCLREYTIKKRPIVEKNNFIIFGEYCWPKSVKTSYQVFNKQKDATKEYYTLECLLFLLNNLKLNHVEYVNIAKKNDVPFIRRPDRKKLLAYLMGEIKTSPSINTRTPVVYPTKIKLEHQKEITDANRHSNFQSFRMTPSEVDILRNKYRSSINQRYNAAIGNPKIVKLEHQKEITDANRNSNFQSSTMSPSEVDILRNKHQSSINQQYDTAIVKPKIEKQEEIKIKPSTEQKQSANLPSSNDCLEQMKSHFLSFKEAVFSSTETNFLRNEKQFSLQRVKQVKEIYEKICKRQKIENSCTLSSSEASISRNESQRYFNHDHISSIGIKEAEEQDEINIKPSTELNRRKNIVGK